MTDIPDHPWLHHYDPGVPASLGEYPAKTLLDYVGTGTAERPQAPALIFNELREWCKARLAPYTVPARVVFRQELPKSMVGKVLRRLLQEDEVPVS